MADLLKEDKNGQHLWDDADDWLALLDDDDLWSLLDNFGGLCAEEEATIHQLIPGMAIHTEADGFDEARAFLADMIGKAELRNPTLRVLRSSLITELLATTPTSPQEEVPLTFAANRILDGTIDDILVIVDRILDTLEAS